MIYEVDAAEVFYRYCHLQWYVCCVDQCQVTA